MKPEVGNLPKPPLAEEASARGGREYVPMPGRLVGPLAF
jgi:hypothetical protein